MILSDPKQSRESKYMVIRSWQNRHRSGEYVAYDNTAANIVTALQYGDLGRSQVGVEFLATMDAKEFV